MGQLGNFAVRVDLFPIRFQRNGNILERVYPYVNGAASNVNANADGLGGAGQSGIKGNINPEYLTARYQINFIWHRKAMTSMVRDTTQIHPQMPFAARDFGGKWQFVQDNLGCAADGTVIENKRRNKGMFIADFSFATKWDYNEFAEVFLTLREPRCVVDIAPCADEPAYVPQDYNSCNEHCDESPAVV
jgi:hypothetical protein